MSKYRNIKSRLLNRLNGASRANNLRKSQQYLYWLDNPAKTVVDARKVTVSGWVVDTTGRPVSAVRCYHAGKFYKLRYGIPRKDVKESHPLLRSSVGIDVDCGFRGTIIVREGELRIEVDFGEGFQIIHTTTLKYATHKMFESVYNPNEAENRAEHEILISNKQTYYYEENNTHTYKRGANDPRLVAFYLPQFHPIPENDRAWGKGFTEWRNVGAGVPRYVGHLQPILPGELGYYDLRLESVIRDQVALAKQHGIFGFCFYYYWFSGKKLLEAPLDTFLDHKEWDFNFLICWANENWTKRWDGRDQEVIVAQSYSNNDPLLFIKDVEHILLDPRYIRENDRPVLMVYRAESLNDPKNYVRIWREYFKKKHKLDLHIISVMGFDDSDPRHEGFDAGLDFAPQTSFFKNKVYANEEYPFIDVHEKLLDVNFSGSVVDYRKIALNKEQYDVFKFPTYKSVTPHWDNDARRKGSGFIFQGSTPDLYSEWLHQTIGTEIRNNKQPLVFINAWNEWAEGAILEPTAQYGYAVLNRTSEVLSQYSDNKSNADSIPQFGITKHKKAKLAVHLHVYYPEDWSGAKESLTNISVPYDLFVTTYEQNAQVYADIHAFKKDAYIKVVPNRGKDVLPFLFIANRVRVLGYDYILKLQTSQHLTTEDNSYVKEVYKKLLPTKEHTANILKKLDTGTALAYAAGDMESRETAVNRELPYQRNEASEYLTKYLRSGMYWCRTDALNWLLNSMLGPDDFLAERPNAQNSLEKIIAQDLLSQVSLRGNILQLPVEDH